MYFQKDYLLLEYYKTRDHALKGKILLTYSPLVEYIAKKLAYNKNDLEDLIQVGNIGLLRSIERFDPSKDIDFSTFATPNIIGEIKHYFRDKSRLVKVPRKLQEYYSKVKNYIRAAQKQGLSPTIPEIAKELELTEEQVIESMEVGQTSMVLSLDSPSYKQDMFKQGDSSMPTLLDRFGVEGKEDFLINKETVQKALKDLDKREKKVIYLRFYAGLSQSEIAKRMNLSQMHISRILTKSIKRLKDSLSKSFN